MPPICALSSGCDGHDDAGDSTIIPKAFNTLPHRVLQDLSSLHRGRLAHRRRLRRTLAMSLPLSLRPRHCVCSASRQGWGTLVAQRIAARGAEWCVVLLRATMRTNDPLRGQQRGLVPLRLAMIELAAMLASRTREAKVRDHACVAAVIFKVVVRLNVLSVRHSHAAGTHRTAAAILVPRALHEDAVVAK